MIKPKTKGIHPCFKSKFKCIDTYKKFIAGQSYEITGFGNDIRGYKKVEVWYVTPLGSKEEFSVIKTTINALVDARVLTIIEEDV
jgi:hypothetical protein